MINIGALGGGEKKKAATSHMVCHTHGGTSSIPFNPDVAQKCPSKLRKQNSHLGLGAGAASSLRLVMECFRRCLRGIPMQGPILGNSADAVAYLRGQMSHKRQEEFRVLFLDHAHQLIADDVLATGSTDSVAVCPRIVAQKCLAYGACRVIVAHNHPAGAAVPSEADLQTTKRLQKTLGILGVQVLEHVIVAKHQSFSFLAHHLL